MLISPLSFVDVFDYVLCLTIGDTVSGASLPSLASSSASSFPGSPQCEGIHWTARVLRSDRVFSLSSVSLSGWSLGDISPSKQDLLPVRMTIGSAEGVSLLIRLVASRMAISSAL